MTAYIVQRLMQMVPVMVLASVISFALIFVLPGDPALLILGEQQANNRVVYEALRRELGLDRPLPVQYLDWLGRTITGNLGVSTQNKQPIATGLLERFPVTLELSSLSMLFSLAIALPSGILSAIRPNSRWDITASFVAFSGAAIPHFWLGILLIYALAVGARLLPASGFVPFSEDPARNLSHMLLPAMTLGLGLAAILTRQVRSSLLDVLQQDYMVTAKAKGLRAGAVILRHGLKNGLIPWVTVIGLQIGALFGGAVVTETIFSLPGIGRWAVDSVLARDFPVVQAVSLLMATGTLFASLVADIAYAYIDPRIRYR